MDVCHSSAVAPFQTGSGAQGKGSARAKSPLHRRPGEANTRLLHPEFLLLPSLPPPLQSPPLFLILSPSPPPFPRPSPNSTLVSSLKPSPMSNPQLFPLPNPEAASSSAGEDEPEVRHDLAPSYSFSARVSRSGFGLSSFFSRFSAGLECFCKAVATIADMPSVLGSMMVASTSAAASLQEALENAGRLIDRQLQEDRMYPDLSELLMVSAPSE